MSHRIYCCFCDRLTLLELLLDPVLKLDGVIDPKTDEDGEGRHRYHRERNMQKSHHPKGPDYPQKDEGKRQKREVNVSEDEEEGHHHQEARDHEERSHGGVHLSLYVVSEGDLAGHGGVCSCGKFRHLLGGVGFQKDGRYAILG